MKKLPARTNSRLADQISSADKITRLNEPNPAEAHPNPTSSSDSRKASARQLVKFPNDIDGCSHLH